MGHTKYTTEQWFNLESLRVEDRQRYHNLGLGRKMFGFPQDTLLSRLEGQNPGLERLSLPIVIDEPDILCAMEIPIVGLGGVDRERVALTVRPIEFQTEQEAAYLLFAGYKAPEDDYWNLDPDYDFEDFENLDNLGGD